MPSRRLGSSDLPSPSRPVLRAGAILACCIGWASAHATAIPLTLDQLLPLTPARLERALVALRESPDGERVLLGLATEVSVRADARRDSGVPPLSHGCLRDNEFEMSAQLTLARQSFDGDGYRSAARQYRQLSRTLRDALADAQRTANWKRRFAHLDPWISDWRMSTDPRIKELLRRTLVDQAIRAALSAYMTPRLFEKPFSGLALAVYDEYVFNRMCTADEENLLWLKRELASVGWFDIRRFGARADHAAWLLVQHADHEPEFQLGVAELLASKLATGDTNSQNYAYLLDRVALRSGRPQTYGTQVECVNGEWLAPKIHDPATLDQRRAAVGLEPYLAQLARGKHLCRPKTQQ